MQVILLKNADNLGEAGDVVTVKSGYGRNYLIPRGLARLATTGAVRARQEELRQQSRKRLEQKSNAENLAKELEKITVVIQKPVGEEERIFGTVTAQDVARRLEIDHNVTVDRRKVEIEDEIRALGVYHALVQIHPEVTARIKLQVDPDLTPSS